MHFVTLTSDWKNDDFYTGALKGALLSSCENASIITLSKQIKAYSVAEAAFVVRNSYKHFPKGTVHIITVGSDIEPHSKKLAARIDDHYFISSDNGIFGLLGDAEEVEVVSIHLDETESIHSFPELSIFAKAAGRILNGEKLETIGVSTQEYKKQVPLRATLENNTITGAVIYIDSYGNAITNISTDLFERICKDREFTIYVQSKHYKITKLNHFYSETSAGDLIAIFNSLKLLEIAIRNGSAKDLLNLNTDSTIRVEFN